MLASISKRRTLVRRRQDRACRGARSVGLRWIFAAALALPMAMPFAASSATAEPAKSANSAGASSEPMKLGGPATTNANKGKVASGSLTGLPSKPAKSAKSAKRHKSKSARSGKSSRTAYKKPGGYVPKTAYQAGKSKRKAVKVAALGNAAYGYTPPKQSVTGGGVRWVASASCLNGALRSLVHQVAASYGSVTVASTCRSPGHNRRVGGARHSHHLTGSAVDFRVHGNVRGAIAFLAGPGRVGGYKHYGGGRFHIDTGPHRTW